LLLLISSCHATQAAGWTRAYSSALNAGEYRGNATASHAYAGSFEATTTVGLGVRARLPFRVFVLAGPATGSRLVIDVAHRW